MYCAVLHVRALFCSLQYIITMFLTGGWFFSLNQFTLSSFYHCFCKIFLHNTHEYTLTWWCRPFFTYMSWIKHTHPAADWKFISLTERIFPEFIIWIKLFDVMPDHCFSDQDLVEKLASPSEPRLRKVTLLSLHFEHLRRFSLMPGKVGLIGLHAYCSPTSRLHILIEPSTPAWCEHYSPLMFVFAAL